MTTPIVSVTSSSMNVSFDDLVFHNPTNGLFEAIYNFPNNYQMSVKTEKTYKTNPHDNREYFVIHPNKYVVNILLNLCGHKFLKAFMSFPVLYKNTERFLNSITR